MQFSCSATETDGSQILVHWKELIYHIYLVITAYYVNLYPNSHSLWLRLYCMAGFCLLTVVSVSVSLWYIEQWPYCFMQIQQ